MKIKIIFLTLAFVITLSIYFLISNKQDLVQKKSYQLYLSNTNFPVLFEDGEWSNELKDFVMTDLNCIYNRVKFKKIIMRDPVKVKIDNRTIISTNGIYYTNRYLPTFLNSSFLLPFDHTISIDGTNYLFVSTNIMHLYQEKLSSCNIPNDFHEKVEAFISGIKNMTPKQLQNKIVVREYKNPSFSTLSVEAPVFEQECRQFLDWFNYNYKSISFSVLYSLKGIELNRLLENKYVDNDTLVMYLNFEFKKSNRGVDNSELQIIYIEGALKLFTMFGGE